MDPLSITTGCIGLISAIGTLSLSINSFVRTYREARSDLDRVARELLSLQTVLELIKDAIDEDRSFPDTLAYHVSGILANCHSVVLELQGCITKYCNNRLRTRASWAISGQGDVAKLRSNLEAHKAALELALDMLALHTAKAIKMDTTEIRNDTSAIKDGTAQILKEINQLQARLSNQDDYILQKFLEDMTTYTENALDGASIDWKSSSTRVPSPIIEDEDVIGSAYLSGSELAHFNVHSNHSEYRVAEEGRLSVWECITNVETYYTGIEGEWRDICLRRRRRAAVMTEQHPPSPSTVPSEFFDAFILSFHWSGPQELDPFADVESFTTHFTASTIPGREFASQDTLRPSRFKPSRQIKIAFYIQVHTWMWLDDFETQLNFISTSLTALAQRVAWSWQNIVIIIEGPPRWMGVDPEILMLFMALGILFESNQSIDYIGRVSVDPPYHMERDEIFERSILGTIYENTVNPSHGANCFKNVLITKSLQVIAVAPHQHQNDPAHYDLQHHNNWAAAVCKVLKPEFIVHIPEGEMAKIPHPDRFLADLWWCRTRFSNSMQDHVNQCVLLTPLEFQTGRVGVRPVRDRIAFLREPLPHPKQPTKPAESVRPRPESTPRNVSVQHRNYVYVLSGLIMLYISFILMCHWA